MKYLLAILCLFALSACEETISSDKLTKDPGDGSTVANEFVIQLREQTVEGVGVHDFHKWLTSRSNTIVIDTITTIVRGNGYCAGYIVVYRTVDVPKPVEKTPREKALEKLTPADREALNLK